MKGSNKYLWYKKKNKTNRIILSNLKLSYRLLDRKTNPKSKQVLKKYTYKIKLRKIKCEKNVFIGFINQEKALYSNKQSGDYKRKLNLHIHEQL